MDSLIQELIKALEEGKPTYNCYAACFKVKIKPILNVLQKHVVDDSKEEKELNRFITNFTQEKKRNE